MNKEIDLSKYEIRTDLAIDQLEEKSVLKGVKHDTEIIDNDEVTEEIPVIYPAVIDSSKSLRKSFQSKLNSLKSKDKNKTIVKSEDLEYDEFDDENIVEKKNFWKKSRSLSSRTTSTGLLIRKSQRKPIRHLKKTII